MSGIIDEDKAYEESKRLAKYLASRSLSRGEVILVCECMVDAVKAETNIELNREKGVAQSNNEAKG